MSFAYAWKRLTECTFEEALQIWNEGFQGYNVTMDMDMDTFLGRLGREGLSANLSFIAYVDGEPAGIVLNGVRTVNGTKIAYNGGTGIAPRFRGTGLSVQMMQTLLDIYQEQGVELATLEAISDNVRAIKLYEKVGYEIIGHLAFLKQTEAFAEEPFALTEASAAYRVRWELPVAVAGLSFYEAFAPWQCQWSAMQGLGGEALLVEDASGAVVGYALFRRGFDENGKLARTTLYHMEVEPMHSDGDEIARVMLHELFAQGHDTPMFRGTFNFRSKQERVERLLQEAGFEAYSGQVFMTRKVAAVEA